MSQEVKKKKKSVSSYDRSSQIYLKEIGKYKSLSVNEEYDLWKKYKETHDVTYRNKIVEANLKFVAMIAKSFNGRGLSYSDLIAEGNIGLMKAIDKFDGSKGYKAITYSVWWIKQTIIDALNKRIGVEHECIDDYINYTDTTNDAFQQDNDECSNGKNEKTEVDSPTDTMDKKRIVDILTSTLTERELYVVTNYYGLETEASMTLDEIGETIGLTKERIRQINDKAILKMKSNALLNGLSEEVICE